ncbi:MAG: chorismate mutase [Candidatus Gastranaerophilales bacterium]|nr:chorismate mutase [Candidatus Gastranaerophilales bacterium]
MTTRGIRGAITLDENSKEAIKQATIELLTEILSKNSVSKEDISHVIFTFTPDINADFPAKYARTGLGFDMVPMICINEIEVSDALKMCFRALVVVNTDKAQDEIHHIYLKGAKKLRPDLEL